MWRPRHSRFPSLLDSLLITDGGGGGGLVAAIVGGIAIAMVFAHGAGWATLYPYTILLQTVPIIALRRSSSTGWEREPWQ